MQNKFLSHFDKILTILFVIYFILGSSLIIFSFSVQSNTVTFENDSSCGFPIGNITEITDYDETQNGIYLYWERAYYTGPNIVNTADFDIPFGILHPYGYNNSNDTIYPLILYTHGGGARSNWDSTRDDNDINQVMQRSTARGFAKTAADPTGNPEYYAFVLAPHVAQSSARWAETDWGDGPYEQTDTPEDTYGEYMHALENLLSFITNNGNNANLTSILGLDANDIDMNRIYVVGDSMGAYGAWDILARQPDLFAAGIAGAGSGPNNKNSSLLQTPIWAFHGTNDGIVPNALPSVSDWDGDGSLGMMAMLDPTFDNTGPSDIVVVDDPDSSSDDPPASARLIYSEYPGASHSVATSWINAESDFRAWLFNQSLSNDYTCPDGLIHYWTLNETSGPIYEDCIGGNDGTCIECPISCIGTVNGAQGFDGVDDNISLSNEIDFKTNYTLSFWMKGDDYNNRMMIGKIDDDNWFGIFSGNLYLQDNSNTNIIWSINIVTGEWVHIVLKGNGMQWEAYKNNISLGSKPISSNFLIDAIGTGYTYPSVYDFDGCLDEIAIFNRPLTDSEIQNIYEKGVSGKGLCGSSIIPGDANEDGVVNSLDITKIERIILHLDPPKLGADANEDGKVNAIDLTKTELIILFGLRK